MTQRNIFLVLFLIVINSCKSQTPPEFVGQHSYDLSKLDTTLDVKKFYSKALVEGENWAQFKDTKERYQHSFRRDTSYGPNERGDDEDTAVKYIVYSHVSSSVSDKLADWNGTNFNKLDMIANKFNKLMAVGAVAEERDQKVYEDLLKELDEKFGKHTTVHKDFFGDVTINLWQTDALEIQLVPYTNDGSNTMKIVVDNNGASQEKAAPVFNFFLYIFVKQYKELDHGRITMGDFTRCN